jgi:hypothetical protein
MKLTKRHIEGVTKIVAAAGAIATRAIVIPLLPPKGTWVVTGTVQAMSADGLLPPVTYFPQFTGSCANGVATANNTGAVPAQPADRGDDQAFKPGGIALVGADGHSLQIEIALTGVTGVAVYWSWALDITTFEMP